jgi:membrane protein YqaA with SNARE-associated domain
MVMLYANQYGPALMAILGGFAYCISALIDYSLVTFAFRSKKVNRIKTTNLYHWLERVYAKWPFGTLALDSFSVIPFEPIKLMACAKQYNRAKYLLACFIGRTVRYYFIGWLQIKLDIPNKYLIGSIVVMLVIELVRRLIKRVRGKNPTDNKEDSAENPAQYKDNMVSQYSEEMAA